MAEDPRNGLGAIIGHLYDDPGYCTGEHATSWQITYLYDALTGDGWTPPVVDPWCREESCRFRHWRSGSMPTHKRGEGCPTY